MKSFEVTEAARTDLLEIWDCIRADNIDAADKVTTVANTAKSCSTSWKKI
jgi:hypothetical protein